MHASILILPLDEFVYVLDDDEYSDDEINDSRYASIYHYIIHVAKDLYDIPI
ncbi:MAG: hypothetical protein BWY76_01830 [bacterium ADurb.Bin429]|nr:MAG: hypothetical protein BWY76_01830 [bacterium ADurb.Bin429]